MDCGSRVEYRFKEFTSEDIQYQHALKLRDDVLRKPLGLSIYNEDLSAEQSAWHFGMFSEEYSDQPLAYLCILHQGLSPQNHHGDLHCTLKQMAVATNHQGRGLGKDLINLVLAVLKKRGICIVDLSARENAMKFYGKQGFELSSPAFNQLGLKHFRMSKQLF